MAGGDRFRGVCAKREPKGLKAIFFRLLDREHNMLFLKNHWERLGIVSTGIAQWIEINRDILSSDRAHAQNVIDKIRGYRERIGADPNPAENNAGWGLRQISHGSLKQRWTAFSVKGTGSLRIPLNLSVTIRFHETVTNGPWTNPGSFTRSTWYFRIFEERLRSSLRKR